MSKPWRLHDSHVELLQSARSEMLKAVGKYEPCMAYTYGLSLTDASARELPRRWQPARSGIPVPAPLDKYQDRVQRISESYGKTQSFQYFRKHGLDIYLTETVQQFQLFRIPAVHHACRQMLRMSRHAALVRKSDKESGTRGVRYHHSRPIAECTCWATSRSPPLIAAARMFSIYVQVNSFSQHEAWQGCWRSSTEYTYQMLAFVALRSRTCNWAT